MIDRLISLFPLWAVLMSALAYYFPGVFTPLSPAIVPLLSVVMLGMGLTLRWGDFLSILKSPFPVFLGVGLQFTVMPISAYFISSYFDFNPEMVAGRTVEIKSFIDSNDKINKLLSGDWLIVESTHSFSNGEEDMSKTVYTILDLAKPDLDIEQKDIVLQVF